MADDQGLTWAEGSRWVIDKGSERHLVTRVKAELARRGWSGAQLAREMDKAGHPMSQPVVSRLLRSSEKTRPKAVTVDQMIGLAEVLEIPFGELLLPEGLIERAEAWRLLRQAADLRNEIRNAQVRLDPLVEKLQRLVADSPDFKADVELSFHAVRQQQYDQDLALWESFAETEKQLGNKPPKRPELSDERTLTPWESVCVDILGEEPTDG